MLYEPAKDTVLCQMESRIIILIARADNATTQYSKVTNTKAAY